MTRQTDKLRAIGKGKAITIKMMADHLGLTESDFIDTAERNDFTGSQIFKLSDRLDLTSEQINCLFTGQVPKDAKTVKGIPLPIQNYPFVSESIITLDDGTRWRKTITITLDEVRDE